MLAVPADVVRRSYLPLAPWNVVAPHGLAVREARLRGDAHGIQIRTRARHEQELGASGDHTG